MRNLGDKSLLIPVLSFWACLLPPSLDAAKPITTSTRFDAPVVKQTHAREVPQLIVKLRNSESQMGILSVETVTALEHLAGVELTYFRRMAGGAHVLKLPSPMAPTEAETITRRLSQSPTVEYAVPDYKKYAMAIPNDSRFNEQWHYMPPNASPGGANLPGAWDITTGDANIVVAVLDSGLLPHSDIDSNITDNSGRVAPGFDFITNSAQAADGNGRDNNPTDPGDFVVADECGPGAMAKDSSWHGTHVAGTIGALTNNGAGVAGVNWVSKIQPIRVLGKCGGTSSDIIDGMYWAAGLAVPGVANNPTPAQVLNMSLGGQGPCNAPYQDAVNAIAGVGSVVVVAAGNDDMSASLFAPGNCNGVITVAGTDINGQYSSFSNFGSAVEISAPGGDISLGADPGILSTLDGGTTTPLNDNSFGYQQGTSQAAPHVAGVVSLMLSKNDGLGPTQVLSMLQTTARPFPQYGDQYDCNTTDCGAGLLDATAALAAVPVPDTTPDSLVFANQTNVALNTLVTSNSITVTGINASAPIGVSGGEYSVGNGAFTAVSGRVRSGQTIRVRHTSAATYNTAASTTLTVGEVSGSFTSTTGTAPPPPSDAGGGGGALSHLLVLLLWVATCLRRIFWMKSETHN